MSLSNRCYRNFLCIGLKKMISNVASNSRLLMLHTSISAQGNQSYPLVTKMPCTISWATGIKEDAKGAKESGIKHFTVQ